MLIIADKDEKKIKGEISITEEITPALGSISLTDAWIQNEEKNQIEELRKQFPFFSNQLIIKQKNLRLWNINDSIYEYVLMKEGEKLTLYPVYYVAGRRTTREAISTELLKIRHNHPCATTQIEKFFLNITCNNKEHFPIQFLDFPGTYCEQKDKYKINQINDVLQKSNGIIFIVDSHQCKNQEIIKIYENLFLKILQYRKDKKKKLMLLLLFTHIDSDIHEDTLLLNFPEIAKYYIKQNASSNVMLHLSMFNHTNVNEFSFKNNFQNFFNAIQDFTLTFQKQTIKKKHRLLFWKLCYFILFLIGILEVFNIYLFEQLKIKSMPRVVKEATNLSIFTMQKGKLEEKEACISKQVYDIQQYITYSYSLGYYFYFSKQVAKLQSIIMQNLKILITEQKDLYSVMIANDALTTEEINKMKRTLENIKIIIPKQYDSYQEFFSLCLDWAKNKDHSINDKIRFIDKVEQKEITSLQVAFKQNLSLIMEQKAQEMLQRSQKDKTILIFLEVLSEYGVYSQKYQKLPFILSNQAIVKIWTNALELSWDTFQNCFNQEKDVSKKCQILIQIYENFPNESNSIIPLAIQASLFNLTYYFLTEIQDLSLIQDYTKQQLANYLYNSFSSLQFIFNILEKSIKGYIQGSIRTAKQERNINTIFQQLKIIKKNSTKKFSELEQKLLILWLQREKDWKALLTKQHYLLYFSNYKIPNLTGKEKFDPYIKIKIPTSSKLESWKSQKVLHDFYLTLLDNIELEIWNNNLLFDKKISDLVIPIHNFILGSSWKNQDGIEIDCHCTDSGISLNIPEWIRDVINASTDERNTEKGN